MNLRRVDDLAVDVGGFDVDLFRRVVKRLEGFGGCDGIFAGEDDAGGTREDSIELRRELVARSALEQGVLDDAVRAAVFAKLVAELRDLFDGEALVVREEQVLRARDLLAELLNRRFFFRGRQIALRGNKNASADGARRTNPNSAKTSAKDAPSAGVRS